MNVKDLIKEELKKVSGRSIIATPESREQLDNFAKGNKGSMDVVLTQMAVQYGFKIALENLLEIFEE